MYHRVREWQGGLCRPVETARSLVVTSVRSPTGEAERDNAKDRGLSAKYGYWRGTRSSAMDKQCIRLSIDFLFCSMKWFTFNHSGIPVLSFLPKTPLCKWLTVWVGGTVWRLEKNVSPTRQRRPRCGHTWQTVVAPYPPLVLWGLQTTIRRPDLKEYASKPFLFLSFLDCFSSIKLDCRLSQNKQSAILDSFPQPVPCPQCAQWIFSGNVGGLSSGKIWVSCPFLCIGYIMINLCYAEAPTVCWIIYFA